MSKRRYSLDITLEENPEVEYTDSEVVRIIVGPPEPNMSMNEDNLELVANDFEHNVHGDSSSRSSHKIRPHVEFSKTVDQVIRVVPEFSGGPDEKLLFFINACEIVVGITPEENTEIMLQTILTRLRGQAYGVIQYESIEDWETLKRLLKNAYDKPKSAAYLQIQFNSARQQFKETVIEYATRLRNLISQVSES